MASPTGTTSPEVGSEPWYRRPWPAGAAVLAVYVALSFLLSTGGSLGTDTGAKVATLATMQERGAWFDLDVGYWAEEWDPRGSMHPLYQSRPTDDARWMAVTTVPMLLAARPLYELGGLRLALLLPMLGAIGAAFGCRALAHRLGADRRTGWVAYWLVALASPMAVYALDFWEHAPGAALMLWAAVHLADLAIGSTTRPYLGSGAAAGLLLGAAATMRTEAFVVALVATAAASLGLLVRTRRPLPVLAPGTATVVGFGTAFLVGGVLERMTAAPARSARAEGVVARSDSLVDQLPDRLAEGLTTTLSPQASDSGAAWLAGAVVVAGVLLAAAWWQRREVLALGGALIAAVVVLSSQVGGLGFVPGAMVAFPLAAAGLLALASAGPVRWVAVAALTTYPLTWLFQYLGGSLPQWGGRYVLVPTLVLGTCGLVWLGDEGRDRRGLRAVGGLCVLVTAIGVSFLAHRTHEIDRTFDELVDRPEAVVATQNGFFVREGMDAYLERRWLAGSRTAGLDDVAEVVAAAGLDSFAWVTEAELSAASTGDFRLRDTAPVHLLGVTLQVHSYRAGD
jgi:hypothetical protein